MSEKIAEINGIRICYESNGSGFPIILAHGYGAKKEIWKPQIFDLAKRYRVITYDIRGLGKSDRPDYLYTMEMLADDVKGLLDHLNIKKAHVGGRSLGGMIAQNFYLKYPEYVKKLLLITTNSGMPNEEAVDMMVQTSIEGLKTLKNNAKKAYWNDARLLFHYKFRKEMEKDPEKKFYGNWSANGQIQESIINPPRPRDLINVGNAIKTHHSLERLSEIKCPTLLIAGTHDKLTPKSSMEKMHKKIPTSEFKLIPKAGHYLTLSHAKEVNQIILDFLKS